MSRYDPLLDTLQSRLDALQPGRLGRGTLLHDGGRAAVYRFEEMATGQPVSVKCLKPAQLTLLSGRQQRILFEQFHNEARVAAFLRGQAAKVVPAVELLDSDGIPPLLIAEYVEGETLERWLEHHPDRLAQGLQAVAKALAVLHRAGVRHGNLQPHHLLLSGDGREEPMRARIVDLSQADYPKASVEFAIDQGTGDLGASPWYASPEKLASEGVLNAADDVYALGVIGYRAATGQWPFEDQVRADKPQLGEGQLLAELIQLRTYRSKPTDPRALNPALPSAFAALLWWMLQKDRGGRPSAAEVASALQQLTPTGVAQKLWTGFLSAVTPARLPSLTDADLPLAASETEAISGLAREGAEDTPLPRQILRNPGARWTLAAAIVVVLLASAFAVRQVTRPRMTGSLARGVDPKLILDSPLAAEPGAQEDDTQPPTSQQKPPKRTKPEVPRESTLALVPPASQGEPDARVAMPPQTEEPREADPAPRLDPEPPAEDEPSETLPAARAAESGSRSVAERAAETRVNVPEPSGSTESAPTPGAPSHTDPDTEPSPSPDPEPRMDSEEEQPESHPVFDLDAPPADLPNPNVPVPAMDVPAVPQPSAPRPADPTGPLPRYAAMPFQGFSANGEQVWAVDIAPDGKTVVTGGYDETAQLWDIRSGRNLGSVGGAQTHENWIIAVAFSRDSQYLATGSEDCTVKVWNRQGNTRLTTLGQPNGQLVVRSMTFSPNSKLLAIGYAGGGGTVRLFESGSWRERPAIKAGSPVRALAFSPDNKFLAVGSEDDRARIFDLASGKTLATLAGHGGWVQAVSFNERNQLATGSSDGTVKVWTVQGGEVRETLTTKHRGGVYAVAFNPRDPRQLATAGADGYVRLWNQHTGAETSSLSGHLGIVTSLAFTDDGRYLVSASLKDYGDPRSGYNVRVWEVE